MNQHFPIWRTKLKVTQTFQRKEFYLGNEIIVYELRIEFNRLIRCFCCRDIFSILRDPACLRDVIDLMVAKLDQIKWTDVDVIVGLESRGFILAPLLAVKLNAGFVPVRKKGRLPGNCKEISYTLEYRSVRT